jgi:hypothetical protein
MTTHLTNVAADSPAIKAWEAVRTGASVVIAVALLMIAARTTMFESADAPDQTVRPMGVAPHVLASSPSDSKHPFTVVFYLVRTPEQASLADLGESDRISEASYRQYQILYAGDDEELRLASQSILDEILVYASTPSVQVIDLRDVTAAGQSN